MKYLSIRFSFMTGFIFLCLFVFPLVFAKDISRFLTGTKVSADSSASYQSISDARLIKTSKSYRETIEANQKLYYYIYPDQKMTLSIHSPANSHLKISFLSETGTAITLPGQKISRKHSFEIPSISKSSKLFLCIFNRQSYRASFTLRLKQTSVATDVKREIKPSDSSKNSLVSLSPSSPQPKKTPFPKTITKPDSSKSDSAASALKQHSKATAKPDSSKSTSAASALKQHSKATVKPDSSKSTSTASTLKQHSASSEKKDKNTLSTMPVKNYTLYPHFIVLSPKDVQKIRIQNISSDSLPRFLSVISTDPSVITFNKKDNTVTAHKEGIAVLYLRNHKSDTMASTCLIRVIGT